MSLPIGAATAGPSVTVYRFQTTKSDRCGACAKHQHDKVFVDAATAEANRAHLGCNCRIVAQSVPQAWWERIQPYVLGGSVDLRAVTV